MNFDRLSLNIGNFIILVDGGNEPVITVYNFDTLEGTAYNILPLGLRFKEVFYGAGHPKSEEAQAGEG